ncbi:MAG: PIN domain-containing protein [Chloroflexota bacterium]|nr:PIN domain-containing protein [Chloroflexota bacterium]
MTRAACLRVYQQQSIISVPQSVLAETAYLIRREMGNRGVIHFLRGLPTGRFRIVTLTETDLFRTAAILEQYADSRIDFVDASVVAVAERLGITRVLTLDRRDFAMVRSAHVAHFELLPE